MFCVPIANHLTLIMRRKKSYSNNKIDFSHRKGTLFPVWALIRFYISLTHEKCQSFELRLLNRVTYLAKTNYTYVLTLCAVHKFCFSESFFFPVAVNRISINRRTIDYDMKKVHDMLLRKRK